MKKIIGIAWSAALALSVALPLPAQETASEEPRAQDELSTRRAPDDIRLEGQVVNVTGRNVSPLVAAAKSGRLSERKGKVQISNENLARTGPGLVGMTGGAPVAELPPTPDSRRIIEQHDTAVARWERNVRESRERLSSLQQSVQTLQRERGRSTSASPTRMIRAEWKTSRPRGLQSSSV